MKKSRFLLLLFSSALSVSVCGFSSAFADPGNTSGPESISDLVAKLKGAPSVDPNDTSAHRLALDAAAGKFDPHKDDSKGGVFQAETLRPSGPGVNDMSVTHGRFVMNSSAVRLPASDSQKPPVMAGSPGSTILPAHVPVSGGNGVSAGSAGRSLAGGTGRPVYSGCLDQGMNTVLEPGCLTHLGPVPRGISSVPLPDLGNSPSYTVPQPMNGSSISLPQNTVSPPGALPSGSPAVSGNDGIVGQITARGAGTAVGSAAMSQVSDGRVSCAISDNSGVVSTLRVADVRSCVVAGTGMLASSYGPFGITMIDGNGSVVAVSCKAYGGSARPVCSVAN